MPTPDGNNNSNSSSSHGSCKDTYEDSIFGPVSPLRDHDIRVAEEDLNETPERRRKCLKELRRWVKSQHHLVNCRTDNNFLLRFLRFQKFDVDDTKPVIDKYVQMRNVHKQWFANLDVLDPRMTSILQSGYLFVLPERDDNGRRVIFSNAAAMDSINFTAADYMRAQVLVYETLLCDPVNQINGLTYVMNEENVTFSHVRIFSPSETSKVFSCCERALPIRHRKAHFVSMPWTMKIVFQLGKSFLSYKMQSRFMTHTDFEALSGHFNSRLLPSECPGGGDVSAEDMMSAWMEEMLLRREEVMALDNIEYSLGGDHTAKETKTSKREEGVVLDVVSSVRKMENGTEAAHS